MKHCIHCNEEITSKYGKRFCTRSCAASYNNKEQPKRQPEGKCKRCSGIIHTNRSYCETCKEQIKGTTNAPKGKGWEYMLELTIGEVINRHGAKSNRYVAIRNLANRMHRKPGLSCEKCPYDKHVEICHIKPIPSFPQETKLSVVNDKSNIMILCPNCHWEFDHPES